MTAGTQGTLFKMINQISDTDFGRMYLKANLILEGLKRSFSLYLNTVPELEDDKFWAMIEDLKKEILGTYYSKEEKTIEKADIRLGISRFTWNYAHGDKSDQMDDLLSFVKTYEVKKGALYRPLFDVIEGYGDDGYGDVLDSFPLFGRKRYEMALNGEIEGDSEDQYQGENYIRMTLEDQTFEKFGQLMDHTARDIDSEEAGEEAYYIAQEKVYKELGLKSDRERFA
jgi:hypothetical protein